MTYDSNQLIRRVRARGSDAYDVRDAAHEAYHALVLGLQAPWERETIHKAMLKRFGARKATLWLHEVHARVVERAVCEQLGHVIIDRSGRPFTLESALALSVFEAIKRDLPYTPPDIALHVAKAFMRDHKALDEVVLMVLELAKPVVRRARPL